MTDALRHLIERMRSPRARWQHSYGSIDVVDASRVDEWADELEALLADQEFIQNMQNAILKKAMRSLPE